MSRQRDAELDRLRSARESAHQRQQASLAGSAGRLGAPLLGSCGHEPCLRSQAGRLRGSAGSLGNLCIRQRASGPRIDSLNTQQERAYQNMKSASSRLR